MVTMKKKGDPLVFAYYVTGHGFGHATRVVEVVRHLIAAGHEVHVVTAAPKFVFTSEIQSPTLFFRKVVLDCGVVQADALTVDPLASLEMYSKTAVLPRASILAKEAEWLKSIKADLVVSDVVPVACQAAASAGINSVCIANFSWDFIYAEYVIAAGYDHRGIIWQVAALILQDVAVGKRYASDKFSGARRLQDAIVLGYQLQTAAGKDISIPDWYSLATNELSLHSTLPTIETNKPACIAEVCTEDFEILHGDIQGFSDTASFFKSLARLDASYDSGKNAKCQMREHVAAAALFNWEFCRKKSL